MLALWAVILSFSDYFHALPKRLAFILSSPVLINTIAYIFITIILGGIILDRVTAYASITLLASVIIFFKLFRTIIKPSEAAKIALELKGKREKRIKTLIKYQRKRKVEKIESEIKQKFSRIRNFFGGPFGRASRL